MAPGNGADQTEPTGRRRPEWSKVSERPGRRALPGRGVGGMLGETKGAVEMANTSRTGAQQKTKPYKAVGAGILSGLIAFGGSLVTALQGPTSTFGSMTDGQWVSAVLAALVAIGATGGVTYAVRNPPA